ncbi:MAG TPA: sigma 54-interacting transcriptional regulator [Vicinamibacterales bacterium]|nr:sigma 54-interacting transcriptional regulator [Vicinamibacterales bacterium]
MTRLLHDRYYAYADAHAWDLATGASVAVGDLDSDRVADLGSSSVHHAEALEEPVPPALMELLDHGREGEPRWVVLDGDPSCMTVRAAEAGRARGFVPVAVDLYLRLRDLLAAELAHRALLLIVRADVSIEMGRAALIDASVRSPRPHVLLSFAVPRGQGRPAPGSPERARGVTRMIDRVREARAHYGAACPEPDRAGVVRRILRAPMPDDVIRQLTRAAKADEFTRTGRHAAAERLLRDVSGALVRRRAYGAAAQTLTSLGRLLLERGRASDAERAFDEAAGHAHVGGEETGSLSARIWQAAARTDAAQLTAAEGLCRATLVSGALAPRERNRALATLARILLWQGRVDEAAALELTPVTEQSRDQTSVENDHDDEESSAFVEATAVRVLLARGAYFKAGQRARELLRWADHATHPLPRVLALTAHLRVLMASGDVDAVRARFADLVRASQDARTPLRLTRVRLLMMHMLRAVGHQQQAESMAGQLRRLRDVVPPLLRDAIDGRVTSGAAAISLERAGLATQAAVSLVTLAQENESDREAVRGVLAFVAESVQSSRLDLWSADAGPSTIVSSAGSGLPTTVGPRVLEAGILIDTGDRSGGELGVPIRLGSRLVAALVARWPADRRRPAHVRDLLDVAAAVAAARIDSMRAAARDTAVAAAAIPELVGAGRAMSEVRRAVARAASAPFAVLVEGESGVGKELVARAIHHLSPRRERRFCDLNCAALPDELLESELFGHARGAFTGAVADRAGLVEEADGGTLFLDEVADLSPRAQAKLLRVLQQQEVRRVGETFSRPVDVRIVSAANRDVQAEAAAGRFRADLLYRLDVIRIRVPPLRERPEDIPTLAHHFWAQVAPRVGTQAVLIHGLLTALAHYHWPGNVRELQNVMAALAVAAPARGQVRASLLPRAITGAAVTTTPSTRLADARRQFERKFIEAALARAGGRRARTARELGLSRQGLLKMMTRVGITNVPEF